MNANISRRHHQKRISHIKSKGIYLSTFQKASTLLCSLSSRSMYLYIILFINSKPLLFVVVSLTLGYSANHVHCPRPVKLTVPGANS